VTRRPARHEVEGRELLQRDERIPLRDDQGRDPELERARPAGEETERDERLRDRSVHRRVLGRHEDVVGHPAAVEPGLLGRDRGGRQALGVEGVAVVRQDQAQVEPSHARDRIALGPWQSRFRVSHSTA
jgi:hypothetical protein